MARSNVLVSYAPAAMPRAPRAGHLSRFRPSMLAVLMTGAAVLAASRIMPLGGETGGSPLDRQPLPPPVAGPGGIGEVSLFVPEFSAARQGDGALPFLGLARQVGAPPVGTPVPRALPAPAAVPIVRPARKAPAAAPARTRLRRDLAGFLSDQGLEPEPSLQSASLPDSAPEPRLTLPGDPPMSELAGAAATPPAEIAGSSVVADIAPGSEDTSLAPADPLPANETLEGPLALAETTGTAETTVELIETAAELPESAQAAPVSIASVDAPAPSAPQPSLAMVAAPSTSEHSAPAAVQSEVATAAGLAATQVTQSFPVAIVGGETLGAVTLRHMGRDGDAIHLGALAGLLQLRMPDTQLARLAASAAADQFVTLDRLRAAGITVQHDARSGRLLIDAR